MNFFIIYISKDIINNQVTTMSKATKFNASEAHAYWSTYTTQHEKIDKVYAYLMKQFPNCDIKKLNTLEVSIFNGQTPHEFGIKAVQNYNEWRGRQTLKAYREMQQAEAYEAWVLQMF